MLLTEYSLAEMFALHARRHEWEHNADELLERLTDFRMADEDPDPVCLRGLDWSDIKLDLVEAVEVLPKTDNQFLNLNTIAYRTKAQQPAVISTLV